MSDPGAWQAEKDDSKRTALMHRYQQLDGTARNLWAAVKRHDVLLYAQVVQRVSVR